MPRALGRDQPQTLMTAHGSKYRFQIRMVKDRMVKEMIAQIVVGDADVFHGCCAAVLEGFCQLPRPSSWPALPSLTGRWDEETRAPAPCGCEAAPARESFHLSL